MKVYNNIEDFNRAFSTENIYHPVITIGTFDGVHLGHQKIIHRMRDIAAQINGQTVVFTFHPHPRMILFNDNDGIKLLATIDEKIRLLEKYGIEHLIIQPFTKEFSRLTSIEFVRDVLVNQLHVKKLVIGYNHQFGRNREGSFEQLQELAPLYDFEVEEISAKDIDSIEISSTKIRKALLEGNMETANKFLGHSYSISGKVVHGQKKGRDIGFPTANIYISEKHKLIPADGVYAVKIKHSGIKYDGMLNIGNNPTIENKGRSIEVNIFDFDKQIYDELTTIYFVKRLRDEKKFGGIDELKSQLLLDKENALKALKEI